MNRRLAVQLYGPALALYGVGKAWHRTASVTDLRFLLSPTDFLVRMAGGGSGQWVDGVGYYHSAGHYVIDGSCAGFNFLLIAYLLLATLLRTRVVGWLLHPLALLLAWPVTVLANGSRIVSMVQLSAAGINWTLDGIGHEFLGGFVYLFFLTCAGLLFSQSPPKSLLG
ncbi:MAG: exosortase K [Lewinella sp.]